MISKNKRINLYDLSKGSGLGADRSQQMLRSDFLVLIKFMNTNFFNSEGSEMVSDGEIWTEFELISGNTFEVVDEEDKTYRIESVDQLMDPSGRLLGYKGLFARDTSME